MMHEAPFSYTIKVGSNNDLFTVRGNTWEEFSDNLATAGLTIPGITNGLQMPQAMQDVSQPQQWQEPANEQQAVQNLNNAGFNAQPVGIEERTDRWGNLFQRGVPDTGFCQHGARVVKHATNKAGKRYKAYACVNDSPFGNYANGKCDPVFPGR